MKILLYVVEKKESFEKQSVLSFIISNPMLLVMNQSGFAATTIPAAVMRKDRNLEISHLKSAKWPKKPPANQTTHIPGHLHHMAPSGTPSGVLLQAQFRIITHFLVFSFCFHGSFFIFFPFGKKRTNTWLKRHQSDNLCAQTVMVTLEKIFPMATETFFQETRKTTLLSSFYFSLFKSL